LSPYGAPAFALSGLRLGRPRSTNGFSSLYISVSVGEGCRGEVSRQRNADGPTVMRHVYILQSVSDPERFYTGQTDDLKQRIRDHNSGKVPHTSKHLPWKIKTYLAFSNEKQALGFEKYLKSASGRAFAKKRL
jgi:putative endonuclease